MEQRKIVQEIEANGDWYKDADRYWSSIEPTVNGMLGGYGFLTEPDAKASLEFVKGIFANNHSMACDCGAGIGRVSQTFLLNVFDKVDLVEQCAAFLETAKQDFVRLGMGDRVSRFIALGLQDFDPEPDRYDLIWCQWVLGHLKDDDLIAFFQRCKKSLRPGGYIGVKENLTKQGIIIDQEDSSCTRSESILKDLFKRAGLRIVKEQKQSEFPKELFAVK
eukprot:jgi/Hompol1/364/HPOL_005294-RA